MTYVDFICFQKQKSEIDLRVFYAISHQYKSNLEESLKLILSKVDNIFNPKSKEIKFKLTQPGLKNFGGIR